MPFRFARAAVALAISAVAVLIGPAAGAFAADVTILGRVTDPRGRPRPGAAVLLTPAEGGSARVLVADGAGIFKAADVEPGFYNVGCRDAAADPPGGWPLELEPGDDVFLELVMDGEGPAARARLAAVSRGLAGWTSLTRIPASQIAAFPTGNSIWSIMENQDLSAITTRIDVGGLWSSTPALFSGRGSSSWTQSTYRLNGLDITDPYDGGAPLVHPDIWSLDHFRLLNGGLPASTASPGGIADLTTKTGGRGVHGSVGGYAIDGSFSLSNVTPGLMAEGITESHSFARFGEFHADAGGPLSDRIGAFTSWAARDWRRDVAEFEADDRASLLSGLAGLTLRLDRGTLDLLWTGQKVRHDSFGAGRRVPFESTVVRTDAQDAYQAVWRTRFSDAHALRAGAGYARIDTRADFQPGAGGQHAADALRGVLGGPAAEAGRFRRGRFSAFAEGRLLSAGANGVFHNLTYGLDLSRAGAASRREAGDGVLLRYFEGRPIEAALVRAVPEERESSLAAGLHLEDTIILPNRVSFLVGLHASAAGGRVPAAAGGAAAPDDLAGRISWFNVSPRLGIRLPLSFSGNTALRLTIARYYFSLPLSYLAYGNPGAPGALIHAWSDPNGDGRFQSSEAGPLLRREGPFHGAIDPDLRRPRTDELSIGFLSRSGSGWSFGLVGWLRESRNLPAAVNTGVPFDSGYDPVVIEDPGDDMDWGTHDDLTFTVSARRPETFGDDFFLLTTPEGDLARGSSYQGLDLTIVKRSRSGFLFFLSGTAMQITGTANPGNQEFENDEAYVGTLYADPNTLINAKGRLRFDRAYTGRIGLVAPLPLGLRFAGLVKYWDGQPFARKIVVAGLPQGPFYVMAHPRGVSRYEFSMTLDLRLEAAVPAGRGVLRVMLDGLNIANFHLATAENEWTSPEYPLRFATEIESPGVVRLGVRYEF